MNRLIAFSLAIDFGLVVLIWMTQLISYPALRYLEKEQLHQWHTQYTWRIGVIVMPLMIIQLGLKGVDLYNDFSLMPTIFVALVVLIWLSTFWQAVPYHNKITMRKESSDTIQRLIRVNWVRTFLWTTVFLLDVMVWMS